MESRDHFISGGHICAVLFYFALLQQCREGKGIIYALSIIHFHADFHLEIFDAFNE
jgi:hypothetical protein